MAQPQTARSTEQTSQSTEQQRSQSTVQQEGSDDRMAAEGTQLPALPGEGQPLNEQPGQRKQQDPAAFDRSDKNPPDRPMEPRTAGDHFVADPDAQNQR